MSKTAEDKLPPIAPTTRWSIVVAAAARGEDLEAGRQAMEQLCQMYWRPVLRFVLRQGYPVHDAQDLTQDFFLTLCDADFLKKASPEKGHFRGLVFASLKNHLRDAADRLLAIKRGGGRQVIHLDEWVEEEAAVKEAADASPEHLFDYDWAALIVRKALRQLHDEFTMRGKEREFDVVRTFLTGGERGNAYAQAATTLSLPVGTVKAMVHRVRGRYGGLLREEVAQTVADIRDLDDEIRYLCQILSAPRDPSAAQHG